MIDFILEPGRMIAFALGMLAGAAAVIMSAVVYVILIDRHFKGEEWR